MKVKSKKTKRKTRKKALLFFWGTEDKYNTLHANQLNIINKLNAILGKETQMAIDLTALTAEVTRNTDVEKSVLALIQNLVTQISNIPPSTDPQTQAAIDALKKTLSDNDDALAAAVTANTPAG